MFVGRLGLICTALFVLAACSESGLKPTIGDAEPAPATVDPGPATPDDPDDPIDPQDDDDDPPPPTQTPTPPPSPPADADTDGDGLMDSEEAARPLHRLMMSTFLLLSITRCSRRTQQ